MGSLYRRLFPFRARDAGVPGLTRLSPLAPHVVALSDLSRTARKTLIASRKTATTNALRIFVAAGGTAPIPPRDIVVAGILTTKGDHDNG